MYVDVYMRCLILNLFILLRIMYNLQKSMLLEYNLILQNKNLFYTESIENSRLNYISKKRRYRGWV